MRVLQTVIRKPKYPHCVKKFKLNCYSSVTSADQKEQAEVVYPEILDVSEIPTELRKKEAYYEKIKKLNTVEEKLLALNTARYYGWPAFHVKEGSIPYNFLPLTQFITRTEVKEVHQLPVYLDDNRTKELLAKVKPELEKVLVFENCVKRFRHEFEKVSEEQEISELEKKNVKTKDVILQINDALIRVLHHQYPHLFHTQIDYEPRIEAFWRVGGFYPTKEDKELRKAKEVSEKRFDELIDRFFQYFGSPILQVRSKLPLPEISIKEKQVEPIENVNKYVDIGAIENIASEIIISDEKEKLNNYGLQEYRWDPKTYLEIPRERIRGVVIPGFWPNDPFRFGLLSYHNSNYLSERTFYDDQDSRETLHCQAILASYAWVYGQACYQGFSTYYDTTYPFAAQTIITNGKEFSFYQYQMNTTVLHTNATSPDNPLKNICYGTLPQELYHDIQDDKIRGWNDEVLLHLVSMYINAPKDRGINLSPYLNPNERVVAQIKDDERRIFLHNSFQNICAHKPFHRPPPEIYDWERIYKIENKRRVLDARKRFFELFQDPINDRKMYEVIRYVPKCLRKPEKAKQKYADIHYPKVCQDYHDIV